MIDFIPALIGVLLAVVAVYAFYQAKAIHDDKKANYRKTEEELWYALWPALARLQAARREEIMKVVETMRGGK